MDESESWERKFKQRILSLQLFDSKNFQSSWSRPWQILGERVNLSKRKEKDNFDLEKLIAGSKTKYFRENA